jgi:hypothetical protein
MTKITCIRKQKLHGLIVFSLLVPFLIAQHAYGATRLDVQKIKALLNSMGTSVVNKNCNEEGLYAYYEFEDGGLDQIVMCIDALTKGDIEEYWETLAHEATHVMQGCIGGDVIDDSRIARVYRELKEINRSSYKELRYYESSSKREEVEARWMELQTPDTVLRILRKSCKDYIR